ncbi:PAS domain-containing sensor histidine kinase [Wenyingzhuangia sp. 1_MG-2023]|nr:PAS domain-containing sensor histidine kinase [Wenyingzhuangia sp. 1_MG-2023]
MIENHIYSSKLASVLNSVFHGVLLTNHEGIVQDYNKSSLQLLKKTTENLNGKKLSYLLPVACKFKFERYFEKCQNFETRKYKQFEYNCFSDTGELRVLELDCNQNFISEEDSEKYTICVIRDITERKNVEKELDLQKQDKIESIDRLEGKQELNDMKSRFITTASHEFRTPLAGILSSIDLIERYLKVDEDLWSQFVHKSKVESHILKIKTSIKTLTGTLNQFLSLGQLEEGRIDYNEEEFDLKETLQNFIDEFVPLLKKDQVINFEFKTNQSRVHLDKNILRHVMNNLLSNAIKYTPAGKNVEVLSFVNDREIQISVRDEGMGIPPEDQNNLFRRFFRAKNATNLQGTGLGLNIVRKYVTLMNGNISFESKEGVGTVFTVKILKK